MSSAEIISAAHLTKRYADGEGQTLTVLKDATLSIAAGDFVALLGPSGSGKSSLLHVLGGLDTDYEGDVSVLGSPLRTLSDAQRSLLRNQRIGFVFQSFHLVPTLTAAQNVALPATFAPTALPDADARARAALQRVGLGEKAQRKPTELSGGERQRVAIARALFSKPPLLLCDEPTGNLDDATGQQIVELFRSLNRDDQVTLVVVTHSAQVAQAAKRVLRLSAGQIVEGTA